MSKIYTTGLMWFRRDLRADDNAALYAALRSCEQVHAVFVFDRPILDALPKQDRRVEFIHGSVQELDATLRERSQHPDGGLIVRHAVAQEDIPALARELKAQCVFTNHDYEPAALARDVAVRAELAKSNIAFQTYKDQVIFEVHELLTQTGKPYSVFTPYKNAWLKKLQAQDLEPYETKKYAASLAARPAHLRELPTLQDLGFEKTNLSALGITPGMRGGQTLWQDFQDRVSGYADKRDFPAVKGPSYLSVHLRFGTVSIRELVAFAHAHAYKGKGNEGAATWLSELIWREFYFQVLANFSYVATPEGGSFKPAYDNIIWETGEQAQQLFQAWCDGQTGYPLVDAAMAQINQTGYMHNRLRMVVASFLCKDLGLDWRWGERYFAEKLNDFEWAANNGGWQWASSSGCDAQPYFRIFNPVSQSRKFDPSGKFIRKYLPALAKLPDAALHEPWKAKPLELQMAGVSLGQTYPLPIVDHAQAREKTLQRYARALAA